jgi:DNA repair exonuclease SbcCD ATPase subunit
VRILRAIIENFEGYVGEHTLSLDRLGLAQVSGRNLDDPANDSNGSGKSTLLEAITWCLFGEGLPRRSGNAEKGVAADEVCNDRIGKQTKVDVLLEDDGVTPPLTVGVVRWRKYKVGDLKRSNGVSIQIGDQGAEQYLDISEGDRRIRQVLGIDRDIWCRSVIFGQESQFNFCEATSKERSDILTTVLGLEVVDRWIGRARDERTTQRAELANLEGQHHVVTDQQAKKAAEQPEVQLQLWEATRGERLAKARRELAEIEALGKLVKDQLAGEDAARNCLREAYQAEQAAQGALQEGGGIPGAQPDQRVLLAAQAALAMVVERERAVLAEIGRLQTLAGQAKCPTCGQSLDQADRQRMTQECTARLGEAQAERQHAQQAFQGAQASWQAAGAAIASKEAGARSAVLERIKGAHEARVAAEREVQEFSRLRTAIEAGRAEWQAKAREMRAIEAEMNPWAEMVAARAAELASLAAELQQVDAQLLTVRTAIAILDWWDTELPRFKTWLFDSVVDALAAEANRWLRIMSGGVIWIQVTTTKQLKDGSTKDELDVQIWRWNPDGTTMSRPYRLWSGGEKRRVSLAVDLGLSRLMAARASKPYRFLALDEIDRHLDSQGREGLRAVLDELRAERETCLIITHDPELRASFDVEIAVTKQGGTSRLEVKRATSKRQEGKEGEPAAAAEGGPVVPADQAVGPAREGGARRKRRARADAGSDPADDGRGSLFGAGERGRAARPRATKNARGKLPGASGAADPQLPAGKAPPDQ